MTGGGEPATLWHIFMANVINNDLLPYADFEKPDGFKMPAPVADIGGGDKDKKKDEKKDDKKPAQDNNQNTGKTIDAGKLPGSNEGGKISVPKPPRPSAPSTTPTVPKSVPKPPSKQ